MKVRSNTTMLLLLINPLIYGMMIPCLQSNMNGSTEKMESISTISTLLICVVYKRLIQRKDVLYTSLISSIFVSVLCISNITNSILVIARVVQGISSRVLWVFVLATLFDLISKRNAVSFMSLFIMFHHVGSCLGQVLGTCLLYYGGKDTPSMVCIFFGIFTFILLKRTNCQSGLYTTFTQVHDFKERIPLFKSNGSELNDTQNRIGLIKDVRMIFCMVSTFITSMVFSTTLLLLSPYLCNVNRLDSFDLHSIIITVFSLANPFICYTSNKSHKVILICTGMSIMSVTLLFLSLQTHSPRYLFVLLSFLGLSNGLIQTNLSSKIGAITHEIGFHDDDQAYALYVVSHVLGSFLALIISDIMNLVFQNERHSLVLLFSAIMLATIPIMMNERMLR